jgi:multicomponent Na+:H+ antiporter subunit G
MSAAEIISTVLVLTGALVALTASIGLLRFRDTLSRMHAATKPQTFGMLLVLSGAGVRLGHNVDIGMLILAGLFVMITAPVVAQRIGQLAYREQRADSGLTRSPTEVPTPDEE